jgi:Anti-sigma-K factor rskA
MTAHEWFVEHRTDYATRALEPADETLYREHLDRCDECRAAVREVERDLSWLPMAVAPVAPRPGFTGRVLREVTGSARPRRRWFLPAAAAAGIALAVGTWAVEGDRVRRLEGELAAARDTLGLLRRANRIMQATIEMHGHTGGIVVFADEVTHRWRVTVHGLPAAAAGQRYVFWFVTGDGMVRGPEVPVDLERPATMTLEMPPGARLIKGCALTVEPMPGDSVPRGAELAHLEL